MKKAIAAFILGGVITAGALGISYGLPITSAAERTEPAKPAEQTEQCTELMKNPDMQNTMKSMMSDDKAAMDPRKVEEMTKQCTGMMKNSDMMKNPGMHSMMNSKQGDDKFVGDGSHSAHHQ